MMLTLSLFLCAMAQAAGPMVELESVTPVPAEITTSTSAEPLPIDPAHSVEVEIDASHSVDVEPQDENQSRAEKPEDAKKPDDSEAKKPVTPPHTGIRAMADGLWLDIKNLPSRPNLYLVLIGGGLAAGVHPFDQTFNVRLRSDYDLVNTAFAPAKYYGGTAEQMGLSVGTYAIGRLFQQPKVSHLGMDLLRAQAISELLVQPLKFATSRQRPNGSNSLSFPSGHAAATFAAATVIERHLGWKGTVLGYGIASYVAASRLHDNVHYLSDVVFGAAIGTIAGRTVTEHGRDVWQLAPAFVPGGAAIVLMRVQ